MGQAYTINLIDHDARKTHLGSVTDACIHHHQNNTPMYVNGELLFTPEDKQIYLQTASTHGDTLKLSISNETQTFLGRFHVSFFDPHSHQAVFRSIGDVELIANKAH